jgi:hypothetical protein
MGANEKLLSRRRAREAQRKKNEERARHDRANTVDAEAIRAILHRVGAVDTWEHKRLDQAAEIIRADAVKKRVGHFRGLQSVVDQMRSRGRNLAQIAELAGVDVRDIQSALRRARTGDVVGRDSKTSLAASPRSIHAVTPDAGSASVDPLSNDADRLPSDERDRGEYDPTRCVRCDVVMLDEDAAPRRGRRRLYCSDTCRRDASAARTAAERYGAPIRVVEVPKFVASPEHPAETSGPNGPVAPMDAANISLDDAEALCELLAHVTKQARLKKLDRATLTAARELSKAVHAQRSW